jgi:hypothetical protein
MSKETYLLDAVAVTIPSGAAITANGVDLAGLIVVRIVMPGAWTAANLTFSGAETLAGTYTDMYDAAGGEYTIIASTSRRIIVPPADLLGNCFLKVRSGTSGTPVNQAADRVITLLVRGVA